MEQFSSSSHFTNQIIYNISSIGFKEESIDMDFDNIILDSERFLLNLFIIPIASTHTGSGGWTGHLWPLTRN